MEKTLKTTFDFIIIGSGLAGLNAALQASQKGSVLIVTKKNLTRCNTFYAQGGIAAVLGKNDDFDKHIQDTLKAGAYHNNRKAVEFIIKKGPEAINRLTYLGLQFSKDNHGTIALGREGGHQENRITHSGDFSGKAIEETLIKNIKKQKNITVSENTFAKDLLVKNKICYGIEITRNHTIENIFARKIILASGGLGQIYERTTNPDVATGDGIAMAYRAGCKIKDMEFIQFHPTAFKERKNPQFLLSEALRGEGAYLKNAQGRRFMHQYHPDAELAPRDIVSRAIFSEEKKGTVYLDISHKGESMKKRFPKISAYLEKQGYDLTKNQIPITPATHFSCGGIQTNLKGETSIKHLYAFGEVACTGLHGANRLASNSLLEALVMSNEILNSKLPKITKYPDFPVSRMNKRSSTSEKKKIRKIRKELQKLMWEKVGIIRNKKQLKEAIQDIQELQKKLPLNNSVDSLELRNILMVALLISKAAIKREKSTGTHHLTNSK